MLLYSLNHYRAISNFLSKVICIDFATLHLDWSRKLAPHVDAFLVLVQNDGSPH